MKIKLALLIHGPVATAWLEEIFSQVKKFKLKFYKIVLVTYAQDAEKNRALLRSLNVENDIELVICKDLINPGFFNINRQIVSVKKGLSYLDSDAVVFKLRNDQSVDFKKVMKFLPLVQRGKILTTNCYTRTDRLYHPSDMFLCGKQPDLARYYDCQSMASTHLTHQMQLKKEHEDSGFTLKAVGIVPESYLYRNYLLSMNWEIKESYDDYIASLRQFMYVLYSWEIQLKWNSKRVPFLKKGSLVLPYSFDMAPFEGGPVEKCRCLTRSEINGEQLRFFDQLFLFISRTLFLKYTGRGRIRSTLLRVDRALVYWFKFGVSWMPTSIQGKLIEIARRGRRAWVS